MRSLLFVFAVVFYATGCATISGRSSNRVLIESEPAGATVRINGEVKGVTPVKVKLDRELEEHRVVLELEGHRPWSETVSRSVNGWYYANIFLNSGLGMIPDALLGSKYSYSTNNISANLMSQQAWEEILARRRAEADARDRARQREEERRLRQRQPNGSSEVERVNENKRGIIEYQITPTRIIGPLTSEYMNWVIMGIRARWLDDLAQHGLLRENMVIVFFEFANLALNGRTRYSEETRLRCSAGSKQLLDRKGVRWVKRPPTNGVPHPVEDLVIGADYFDLVKIVEADGPVRCRLEGDSFDITPGTLQGIRNLLAVIPVS